MGTVYQNLHVIGLEKTFEYHLHSYVTCHMGNS
jgi:hypothetical protein